MSDVSIIVVKSALEFIDYAMFATGVLIAYYIFRAALYEEEGHKTVREAETAENREKLFGWGKKKYGEMKEEAKREERKHFLSGTLSFIIKAGENAEEALTDLRLNSPKALSKVKERVERVAANLRSAKRTLRSARLQSRGHNEKREYLTHLAAEVEVMELELKDKVIKMIPHDEKDREYRTKIQTVEGSLKLIKEYCGVIHRSINNFEKTENLEKIGNFTRTS